MNRLKIVAMISLLSIAQNNTSPAQFSLIENITKISLLFVGLSYQSFHNKIDNKIKEISDNSKQKIITLQGIIAEQKIIINELKKNYILNY
jgi:hypothetical protein